MSANENALVRRRNLALMAVFVLTMFLSAALLFLIQPMFARMVLPLLGGTSQVWNTAMVFYQSVLLLGYLYSHVTTAYLSARRQVALHGILLFLPFLVLPIALPVGWLPPVETNPIPWLLALFTVAVGLPFLVVSTTSPLLQLWFAGTDHPDARDPYFLYSASNLGSILGLLSYPFLLEPTLRLDQQSILWAIGYGALAAFILVCVFITKRWQAQPPEATPEAADSAVSHDKAITTTRRLRWVLWAFIPSSLMLSVTTYLTTDIAAVPLLWIIPMVLYLLSFVLAFARKPIVRHPTVLRAFRLMLLVLLFTFLLGVTHLALAPLHLLTFLIVAWACHGALAHDRPQPKYLTEFYLWLAIGGALGGIFNTLLAPILFNSVPEYYLVLALAAVSFVRKKDISSIPQVRRLDFGLPIALGFIVLVVFLILGVTGLATDAKVRAAAFVLVPIVLLRMSRRRLRFALGVIVLMLVGLLVSSMPQLSTANRTIDAKRGFFGVHKVDYIEFGSESYHGMYHGSTLHGLQSLNPVRRQEPLTYFHRTGPIGQVFDALDEEKKLKDVGIVGLGAGTLACYSQPGQNWTYYEIDPLVVETAQDERFFSFLSDCAPTAEIVLGDGRLSLDRADNQQFDLLVLDAYSSDSIPMHLISREAFALYLQRLAPQGLLAFHISNRYLNLKPALGNLALDANLVGLIQRDQDLSKDQADLGKTASEWVIMARSVKDLGKLADDARWQKLESKPEEDIWTDDFSSILRVLRFR